MDDDNDVTEDKDNNNSKPLGQVEAHLTGEFLFPDENPQLSFIERKNRKWNILEIVLLLMSIVLVVIGIGFFIAYLLIESVPSLYTDSQMKKSLLDNKKYEVIQLLNGIEALLIYEPGASMSSASLSIDAGILGDQAYGVLGLGELVKSVIINKETRANKEMNSLIEKHFGIKIQTKRNLFSVSYSYDVGREGFLKSLDLFSQIIKMNGDTNANDVTLREKIEFGVKDLNRSFLFENISGIQIIPIRNVLYRILGYGKAYNPSGNEKTFVNKTFTIEMLQEKVIKYYEDNYIGHKMKLVVTSRLPLKEIRGIVIKLFSDIQGNYTPIKDTSLHLPVSPGSKLGKILFVSYTAMLNYFKINFLFNSIPYDTTSYYFKYLTYLFQDKSKGSLMSLLMANNLIISLLTSSDYLKEGTYMFTISFQLTTNGLSHIDLILEQTFNFIRVIRDQKPNEAIYKDMRRIHHTIFKFREEAMSNLFQAEQLSLNMIIFKDKIPQIQYGPNYVPRYNKEFNNAMFDLLTPQNSITILALRDITAEGLEKLRMKLTNESEVDYIEDDIYSIKYAERDFKESYLNRLLKANEYDDYLAIKKKNKYLTNLNTLVKPQSEEEKNKRAPKLIKDLNHLKVWHKVRHAAN